MTEWTCKKTTNYMSLLSGSVGVKLPSMRWQSLQKPTVFILALLPFLLLLQSLLTGQLGPNPIDTLTDQTGTFAIRMLLISLMLTPLRWLLKNTSDLSSETPKILLAKALRNTDTFMWRVSY